MYFQVLIKFISTQLIPVTYRLLVLKIFEKEENTPADIYLSLQLNCSKIHIIDVQLLFRINNFFQRANTQSME